MPDNEKPLLKCSKCKTVYHYKVPLNWFFKNILFFIPIKTYFCAHCLKVRYRFMTSKKERKYASV